MSLHYQVDWHLVCLVCLQEDEKMRSVFSKEDESSDLLISEKIMKCSNLVLKNDLSMPQQICHLCLADLVVAYRFRTNCETSGSILTSFQLPQTTPEVTEIKIPAGICVKKVEVITEPNIVEEKATIIIPDEKDDELSSDNFVDLNNDIISEHDLSAEAEVYDEIDYYENTEILEEEELQEESLNNPEETDTKEEDVENETYQEETTRLVKRSRGRPKKIDPDGKSTQRKNITKRYRNGIKPPRICDICGNSYKYQHALDSHMRRHRNEKPFACDFCDKAFVANVELRRHMRVHTGQKPYACKFCDRCFSDFGSRIKHERTHTGERPYVCQVCGKSFAYAHVLNVHNLTHTGQKRFKCNMCGKGFTKKKYLQTHMASHTVDGQKQQIVFEDDVGNTARISEIDLSEPAEYVMGSDHMYEIISKIEDSNEANIVVEQKNATLVDGENFQINFITDGRSNFNLH